MSFDTWMAALLSLLLLGTIVYTLATGRVTASGVRIDRRADRQGYWLGTGFLIAVAALFCFTWFRAIAGSEPARFRAELFFVPYFLYLAIEALRTGEVRWGSTSLPRHGRAQAYWTALLLYGAAFAFFAAALIYL